MCGFILIFSSSWFSSYSSACLVVGLHRKFFFSFLGLPLCMVFLIERLARALRLASCSARLSFLFLYGGHFLRSNRILLFLLRSALKEISGFLLLRFRASGTVRSSISLIMFPTLSESPAKLLLFSSRLYILHVSDSVCRITCFFP